MQPTENIPAADPASLGRRSRRLAWLRQRSLRRSGVGNRRGRRNMMRALDTGVEAEALQREIHRRLGWPLRL